MKIAYLLSCFPKISESFVLNELVENLKSNVDVSIFSLSAPVENIMHDEFVQYKFADKIYYYNYYNILNWDIFCFLKFFIKCIIYEFVNFRLRRDVCKIAYFATIMKNKNITHIHAHFATNGIYAKELSTILNIPYTLTTHAYDIYANQNAKKLINIMEHADTIVTISEYNKNYLKKEIGIQNNIEVIRCGINLDKFTLGKRKEKSNTKFKILTVSRLVEKKGIEYLLRSIPLVVKENSGFEFVIIGSGPLKQSLETLATNLNVKTYLTFKGDQSDSELLKDFNEADLFVLPCIIANNDDRDGIPVALMEAMAMQIPVISTNISGIPELIENDVSGLLVEPKNEQTIADAIIKLSKDKELRIKMGNMGRKIVIKKFNQADESKKLIALFREIERKRQD